MDPSTLEALFKGAVGGAALGIIGGIIALIYKAGRSAAEKTSEIYTKNKPKIEAAKEVAKGEGKRLFEKITKTEQEKLLEIDNKYFEQANKEIEEGSQNQGLWLKSLSLVEGDENKQKSLYIKLRALELNKQK
tara:strand:+ start:115 stop:513 length:399 start_codon:yes stop_codon:yes gene_type:complete